MLYQSYCPPQLRGTGCYATVLCSCWVLCYGAVLLLGAMLRCFTVVGCCTTVNYCDTAVLVYLRKKAPYRYCGWETRRQDDREEEENFGKK